MAEKRDAFGNPIGPQQTKGVPGGPTVGGTSRPSESGLPNTQSATTGVPQQYDARLESSGPQAANQSFGTKRVNVSSFGTFSIVVLVVIIVVGAMIIGGLGIFSSAKDAYDSVKTSIEKASTSSNGTGRTAASGVTGASMMSPQKFGEAKRLIAASDQGDPYLAVIYPEYLSAQLINGDKQTSVLVNNDSDSANVLSRSAASSALSTFKLSQVADATPAFVVKRAADDSGHKMSDIAYVTIQKIIGPAQVRAYFKDGTRYSAKLDGTGLKKES